MKPLPCPFCGGHAKAAMHGIIAGMAKYRVSCTECDCNYGSPICESMDAAISAHNRVAKVVMDTKAKEASDGDEQETVADIVREMLDYDGSIEEFACRIEVAHKREMAVLAKASGEREVGK